MIYKCAKCGEEFKDMKKCDVHEKNCNPMNRINQLEKMIVDLSMKIVNLEARLAAIETSDVKYSEHPYPYAINPCFREKLVITSKVNEYNPGENQ